MLNSIFNKDQRRDRDLGVLAATVETQPGTDRAIDMFVRAVRHWGHEADLQLSLVALLDKATSGLSQHHKRAAAARVSVVAKTGSKLDEAAGALWHRSFDGIDLLGDGQARELRLLADDFLSARQDGKALARYGCRRFEALQTSLSLEQGLDCLMLLASRGIGNRGALYMRDRWAAIVDTPGLLMPTMRHMLNWYKEHDVFQKKFFCRKLLPVAVERLTLVPHAAMRLEMGEALLSFSQLKGQERRRVEAACSRAREALSATPDQLRDATGTACVIVPLNPAPR